MGVRQGCRLALMMAAALTANCLWTVDAQDKPANPSSHEAGFLTELFGGRVVVYRAPNFQSDFASHRKVARLAYFTEAGEMFWCNRWGNGNKRWRIAPHDIQRAMYRSWKQDEDPDVEFVKRGGRLVFYDPAAGGLRTEKWNRFSKRWVLRLEGWIQESWPAAGKRWCPDLELPAGLSINENQTENFWEDMRKQDPDAPIRHFKGVPAMSTSLSYLAPSALKRFLAAQNGHVLEAARDADGWEAGSRYVLVLNRELDELWRLEPDSDVIEDIAYLTKPTKAREIVVRYEQSSASHRYRFGDPFPLAATGERYGAFKLMDWLTAGGREVGLPFMERESVGFVFERGGTVRARKQNGEAAPGRWWWSRGELVIRLDGVPSPNSYPWQSLGVHVGWTDS